MNVNAFSRLYMIVLIKEKNEMQIEILNEMNDKERKKKKKEEEMKIEKEKRYRDKKRMRKSNKKR